MSRESFPSSSGLKASPPGQPDVSELYKLEPLQATRLGGRLRADRGRLWGMTERSSSIVLVQGSIVNSRMSISKPMIIIGPATVKSTVLQSLPAASESVMMLYASIVEAGAEVDAFHPRYSSILVIVILLLSHRGIELNNKSLSPKQEAMRLSCESDP